MSLPCDFISKKGRSIVIRLLEPSDGSMAYDYINQVSKEDTYISFSGETISLEEEESYIESCVAEIINNDGLYLVAEFDNQIVALVDAKRNLSLRSRARHIMSIGISVRQDFRHEGLGRTILQKMIEEISRRITGVKILTLGVFSANEVAIKMYQSLGFQQYGVLPRGILYRGEYIDHIEMYLKI